MRYCNLVRLGASDSLRKISRLDFPVTIRYPEKKGIFRSVNGVRGLAELKVNLAQDKRDKVSESTLFYTKMMCRVSCSYRTVYT